MIVETLPIHIAAPNKPSAQSSSANPNATRTSPNENPHNRTRSTIMGGC